MELKGSEVPRQEDVQGDIVRVLVDVTGGEAQFLADAIEKIASGAGTGGRLDDGENLFNVYLVP